MYYFISDEILINSESASEDSKNLLESTEICDSDVSIDFSFSAPFTSTETNMPSSSNAETSISHSSITESSQIKDSYGIFIYLLFHFLNYI